MLSTHRLVTNLCFHGVGEPRRALEPGEGRYWITPTVLEGVLDLVAGRDDVTLSFDDGNVSDVETGLPALVDRGLTAEFFLLAGRLDGRGSLSRGAVKELVDAGMSIGSHGMHHVSWREAVGSEREAELGTARSVLADVAGRPVDTAACPLGLYDRQVLADLRRRGYVRVMTSDRSRARVEAWLQPRYSLTADDDVSSVRGLLDGVDPVPQRVVSALKRTVKRWR